MRFAVPLRLRRTLERLQPAPWHSFVRKEMTRENQPEKRRGKENDLCG